ncbi:cation diffusion facilitator family transporter [Planococcus halotolerans]|uniref:Cation transporter n=1 Tax=Planococcus halotolerans TaxID=2233542 RepID=A0A365KQT5_9BACL|nr:cation diffusion facilitator family transporter [Planococcus halotolerans]QHJ69515.1 cation diffusion facilitator family transporter [Planococcus halotolerans]RAZ75465.1 cation transporter [Planococcus halotolerans]
MGHDHNHFETARSGNKKALILALVITFSIMLLEFFGGLFTNSLALIADSGHMLSDAVSLLLSLGAIWFAGKAASANKTYGYYRFEIIAAFFNGITLFLMAGFIIYEAVERFNNPPEVMGGWMLAIAGIGLAANILSAWVINRKADVKGNLNMKSAYLHVIGDALGSVGAIIAGVLILLFDWTIADPLISVLVALLILRSAWGVLQSSIHILMEGSPVTVNVAEVKKVLMDIDGVLDVHDLHVWTITSGMDLLTCHMDIEEKAKEQEVLKEAIALISENCKIEHTTIQIEKPGFDHHELKV